MRTLLLLVFLSTPAAHLLASLPLQASLEEMVQSANHIFVGRVVGVDMIDGDGEPLRQDDARTGPGLGNTIRLIVEVEEILVTTSPSPPRTLRVPLDPMMHSSLGQIRQAHAEPSESFLLFFRGEAMRPILPGVFARPLEEREEALLLHAKYHQ